MPYPAARPRQASKPPTTSPPTGAAPEPVHGHSWTVEALLEAAELDDEGMGFDFVEARGALRELASRFDHRHVNRCRPSTGRARPPSASPAGSSTSSTRRLPGAGLAEVTVWEGPACSATYRPA